MVSAWARVWPMRRSSRGAGHRVFVLLSDGECDEGSNWEAILFAGHHRLVEPDRRRRLQQDTEPQAPAKKRSVSSRSPTSGEPSAGASRSATVMTTQRWREPSCSRGRDGAAAAYWPIRSRAKAFPSWNAASCGTTVRHAAPNSMRPTRNRPTVAGDHQHERRFRQAAARAGAQGPAAASW